MLASVVSAQAQAAAATQGLTGQMAAASEALGLLEGQLEQADADQSEALSEAIQLQEALMTTLEQELLGLELAALHETALASPETMKPALESAETLLILAMQELEKELYTEEELTQLQQIASLAVKSLPGATALPVQHVISSGFDLHLTVSPIVYKHRAYAPVRDLAEALGATVLWDDDARTVTISGDGTILIFQIGSNVALLNGQEVLLEAPARIVHGYTVTPVRLVVEQLGAEVRWHDTTQSILISRPAS
jgi:hypothetical protein